MNQDNINKLMTQALAIEAEEAKDAGALGFMARALVQATMPHKKQEKNEFVRKNGDFKLTMLAPSHIGLPYGSIPRLLMAWICTEACTTKKRELVLGRSLSEFMEQIGLVPKGETPTGGRWGNITRLRDQMARLFSCAISCTYTADEVWAIQNVTPVTKANLWWDPKHPNQMTLFESTITLGEDFFNEVTEHPIPIDLRALKALKRSPLALDIYTWATYKTFKINMGHSKGGSIVPWVLLHNQFGSNYAHNAQGIRNFKKEFLKELHKVYCLYEGLNVSEEKNGLSIGAGKTHIKSLKTSKS